MTHALPPSRRALMLGLAPAFVAFVAVQPAAAALGSKLNGDLVIQLAHGRDQFHEPSVLVE